jgi:hypothetical protein
MKRAAFILAVLGVVWSAALTSSAGTVEPYLDPAVTYGVVTLPDGQELSFHRQGAANTLANSGDYMWWYGCSATSAGMLIGYYDRNGYAGHQYPNMVAGGTAEALEGPLERAAIASSRHISDFYRGAYNTSGDDLAGAPTGPLNCLADYMGTNQDAYGNVNGGTTFWNYTNGSRLYAKDIYNLGPSYYNSDGMFGVYEYVKYYAGYNLGAPNQTTAAFSQYIYGYNGNTQGFTWNDYKAEIDAGRPVMIQVEGHSMFGYGYNDTGQQIILHDTWSAGAHTMPWGGSYSGLAQYGVMCLQVPEPSTIILLGVGGLTGLLVLAFRRRR